MSAFCSQMAMIRAMAVVAWMLMPDFVTPSVTRELGCAVWTFLWSTVCRQALNPGARTGREALPASPGVLKAPSLALEASEHSTLQSIKCNLSGCYLKCLPCFYVLNRLAFQILCVKIRWFFFLLDFSDFFMLGMLFKIVYQTKTFATF